MTRVVILLSTPAGHMSVYFASRAHALKAVADWHEWQIASFGAYPGQPQFQNQLLTGTDPKDPPGVISWSVILKAIVGMYLPNDEPTAQERIADAIERQSREGDEWKQ